MTMLPAVSAEGDIERPMLVFKGSRVPYRVLSENGRQVVQTYGDCLPRGYIVGMREQEGGVDTPKVLVWCTDFTNHVAGLTQNGRKVLLIVEGYRSHMSLSALEKLHNHNIIVYALPAHTSGNTEPLDVNIFSPSKAALNEAINIAVSKEDPNKWDTYSSCNMMRFAYEESFSIHNIKARFRRSGIWPFNASHLLSILRPRSHEEPGITMSVTELECLFEQRRRDMRKFGLGSDSEVTNSDFVDTTNGQVLTSTRALQLAREKHAADQQRKLLEQAKAAEAALRAARCTEKAQVERYQFHEVRWQKRADLAGVSVELLKKRLRSVRERRAVARRNAIMKRQARMNLRA